MRTRNIKQTDWRGWELALRDGEGEIVRRALAALRFGAIERSDRAKIAALAFRAYAPEIGLRALKPLIGDDRRTLSPLTDDERLQYAGCLMRVGAVAESRAALATIDGQKCGRVFLYRAYLEILEWNYAAALRLLTHFLSCDIGSPYEKLVARTNLAACLVTSGKRLAADHLIRQLERDATVRRLPLVRANLLEIAAQHQMTMKKWETARQCIEKSFALLEGKGMLDELFVKKWNATLRLRQSPNDVDALHAVGLVRAEALRLRHGETVRDCDRQIARATNDRALFRHLYFGTPYTAFRETLRKTQPLLERWVEKEYVWQLGGPGGKQFSFDALGLPAGFALARAMTSLTSDFYRPRRLAALHADVHPGISFESESAQARVHQLLIRLRKQFAEAGAPLRIRSENGSYRLEATSPLGLRIPLQNTIKDRAETALARLRDIHGGATFSCRDAAHDLSASDRNALRILKEGLARNEIEKIGARSGARYRFRA